MIPDNRDELQVLAGEYVLGLLEPEAMRELEAALATHAALREAVAFWQERLLPVLRLVPAAEPPSDLWQRIEVRLAPTQRAGWWQSLPLWRGATAAALTLAASIALYIALSPPAPSYVAVLRAPQQEQAAFVATAGGDALLIHAVAQQPAPADRGFELWAIPPGGKPRSLGVIPADGRLELGSLPLPVREGTTLAISIEPKSGSPTGQPTGPVVFVGTLLTAR